MQTLYNGVGPQSEERTGGAMQGQATAHNRRSDCKRQTPLLAQNGLSPSEFEMPSLAGEATVTAPKESLTSRFLDARPQEHAR